MSLIVASEEYLMKDIIQKLVPEISPQIISGKKGSKLGIFIEMKDYELLLERLEEFTLGALATAVKKSKSPTKSLEQIEKELQIKQKKDS